MSSKFLKFDYEIWDEHRERTKYMKTMAKLIYATLAVVGLTIAAITSYAAPDDIFVASRANNVIYKFTPDGTRSAFAPGLNFPTGLAFDAAGKLLICRISVGDKRAASASNHPIPQNRKNGNL